MLIASRGYPQIYYGTEIMLDGIPGDYQGHRFDFPGGWANDKRNAFTREGRTDKENEVFNYLKQLLHYRKDNAVLQSGKMIQFIPENGLYVFFRINEQKTVMVVCNNNPKSAVLPTAKFAECIQNFKSGTEITSGKVFDIQKEIAVEGKTVLLLELEK
jgi:glycosidase